MQKSIPKQHPLLVSLIVIVTFTGCQKSNEEGEERSIIPIEISEPELFIDFEQHGLLVPWQVEFLSDGSLSVLDLRANNVIIIDTEGELKSSFGRSGRGPGEFIRPVSLQKFNGDLFVFDADLMQVSYFNSSGEFVHSFSVETREVVTVIDENRFFEKALGEESSLVKKINRVDGSILYFGDAMGDEFQFGDMEMERRVLQRGEIPTSFKNKITMYYESPYLYVFLNAYSRLQKYSEDGDMIWDQPINLAVNNIIFNTVVDRANEAGSPGSVPVLRYITSMKVINGKTYILWSPVADHSRKLVKINQNGIIEHIYHIPEEVTMFADFSIDPKIDMLYLSAPEMGQIYRVKLPN